MSAIGVRIDEWPRHVNVTGRPLMFLYERCDESECVVGADGVASGCGRVACPTCGSGGANLVSLSAVDAGSSTTHQCSCGNRFSL